MLGHVTVCVLGCAFLLPCCEPCGFTLALQHAKLRTSSHILPLAFSEYASGVFSTPRAIWVVPTTTPVTGSTTAPTTPAVRKRRTLLRSCGYRTSGPD